MMSIIILKTNEKFCFSKQNQRSDNHEAMRHLSKEQFENLLFPRSSHL